MIICLRTDKPQAEIWLNEGSSSGGGAPVAYTWNAHKELSDTLHSKLISVLDQHGKSVPDISGIVFYAGPGSFTGLRIGASVAQALSWSLGVPLVGTSGEDWAASGLQKLHDGDVTPALELKYGSKVYTTEQKK